MNKSLPNRIFIFLALLLLITLTVNQKISAQTTPPDFLWAESVGGNGSDMAADLAIDQSGNVIATGYFEDTVFIAGGSLISAGGSDIFVAKYRNDGSAIWALREGGIDYDQAYSVTVDNQNNIIITGYFSGTANIGGTVLTALGNYDVFVAKYDSNGAPLWAKQGAGQGFDYGYEVTTDNQNNILVTGTFQQFASFGSFNVQSPNPNGDVFLVKYNPLGTEQWVQATTSPAGSQSYYNSSNGVTTDNNNNVFITGEFSDQITFGDTVSGSSTSLLSSYDGTNIDVFLAKYNSLGNLSWVTQAGSDSSGVYAFGNDVKVDKDGNILFTGSFNMLLNFGGISLTGLESSDIFIAKYDQLGNAIWAVQDYASTLFNEGIELDLDDAGNISLIGNVAQDLTGGESDDVYFARYTNSGQKLWGMRAGISNSTGAGGIANDSKGDIYGCGYFYTTGLFGTHTLNGINGEAFISKLPSPKFNIVPNPVDFGSLPVFSIDSMSVAITNTSEANLHIYSIIPVVDTSGSFPILGGFPLDSVVALQTSNLILGFIPIYPGLKNVSYEITSDASTSPDTLFATGTGIVPNLTLSDSVLNFGSVDVGITSQLSLSLVNLAYSDMVIDSITISGINASQFSFSPNINGDTLHPFGIQNLTVSFTPDTSGLKNANLIIYSSSGSSPDNVLLQGNGLSLIQVQLPSSPSVGQSTPINIIPPSTTIFTTKDIYYRKTGDLNYQFDTLTTVGLNYTFNIPPEYSTIAGIQFYVVFTDELLNTITYPSLNPDTNPASIEVTIPQMNFPSPIKTGQYQMFSVPLSINSPQIDSVLTDDYGPYDNKVWRILRWQPGLNNYAEYNAISGNIVPGNAFWLINRDGKTFDINNSQSVPSFNNYTITIQPGYNQIADPFAFPIDWITIENSGLLLQAPIHWNADIQDYEIDQLILDPWEGYWIYNQTNQIIDLNVNPNLFLGKKQTTNLFTSLKNDEFLVQVKAVLNSTQSKDQQNFVGMMEDAKSDLDKYDVMKPPAINDQVKVLIESGKNYFARDVVPVSNDGAYWDFSVETKLPNQKVTLIVDKKSSLPDKFDIWVLDKNRKIPVEINNGSAEIITQGDGKSNLRIIIGTEDYAKINSESISLTPFEYALYQNYPNPFNPTTNITYQIKEKSNVTLEIYDILGRRIASVINNVVQDPGQHIVTWNGTNSFGTKVASGIYIYRIRARDFISSKKMILLK